MKSLTNTMLGLVSCIITDTILQYPSMTKELEFDRSRLSRLAADHGEHLFTIILPDVCAWFHQALDEGRLPSERPHLTKRKSKKDDRPEFLWSLYCELFDDSGTLRLEHCPNAVFFIRQILLSCKKWKMDCKEERVHEAYNDFMRIEEELPPSYADTWDSNNPKWVRRPGHPLWGLGEQCVSDVLRDDPMPTDFWTGFERFCARISSSFGPLDVFSIKPKHGPGVTADRAMVKYNFYHWPEKLGQIFPADYFASHDFVDRTTTSREYPSRVAAVPKTQKGPRLICSEPTAHQWIQGGIQRWLERAISMTHLCHAISLHDQEPSRDMALTASTKGELATVDLSSASDRLSTRLVEYVFSANHTLLDALHASRSRTFKLPDGRSGTFSKFAPQGSACTFPVQSIVFAMISAYVVSYVKGVTPEHGLSLVRVFGDDIIIPRDSYEVLLQVLTTCGLKVNQSKSFANGYFRESCGMDAYKGVDVTPAYARSGYNPRNPETLASVIECSNNFHKKGLWHTADYLLKTVPEKELALAPISDRVFGSCTIHTFCKGASFLKQRYNADLHCMEFLIIDVASKASFKIRGTGEASCLQYFIEAPHPSTYVKWESGETKRPLLRKQKGWVQLL